MLTKQDTVGKQHLGQEQEGKGTRRTALPRGSQSRVSW